MTDINNPPAQLKKDLLARFDKATTQIVALAPNKVVTILAPNPDRAFALVVNLSENLVALVCGDSPVVMDKGLPLRTRDSKLVIDESNLFTGKIVGTSSKGAELAVWEGSFN